MSAGEDDEDENENEESDLEDQASSSRKQSSADFTGAGFYKVIFRVEIPFC